MRVVVFFKNGEVERIENVYNVFWSNNKLQIKDIKGNKYEFEIKETDGYSIWDN